jgi:hypothetical protein
MAGKGQGAFVSIGANTEELQAGMDEAQRIVKDGKNEIEGSFQNWSGNTNAVADATNQLSKSVKDAGASTKGLVKEVQVFTAAAGEAEMAASAFSVAGIAGMVAPLAAAALGLAAVKAFKGIFEDMAKEAKDAADAVLKQSEAIIKLGDELQKIRTQGQSPLDREKAQLESLLAVRERLTIEEGRYLYLASIGETDAAAEAQRLMFITMSMNPTLDAQLVRQKEIVAELQKQSDLKNSSVEGPGDLAGEVKFGQDKSAVAQIKAENAAWDLQIAALVRRNQELVKGTHLMDQETPGFINLTPAEAIRSQAPYVPRLGPGNDAGAAQFGADTRAMKDATREARELASAGDQIAAAFGQVGVAIGGSTGSIVQQIAAVVMLTLKFIGLAIAASAASAGQTPIIGPWAAIAGGIAVAAALVGLITGLADGGPMEAGRPYLVGERGPEMVVPTASGTVIPNHQLGRGGGVTVNITAADAGSFEAMLRRNDNALVRVLREASRNGRA